MNVTTCKICYEEIDNLVYYKTNLNEDYKIFCYCDDCLQLLIKNMWNNYIHKIKTIDCESSLKRLILDGPPLYFKDYYIENGQNIVMFKIKNTFLKGKINIPLNDEQLQLFITQLKLINFNDDYLTNINTILIYFNL